MPPRAPPPIWRKFSPRLTIEIIQISSGLQNLPIAGTTSQARVTYIAGAKERVAVQCCCPVAGGGMCCAEQYFCSAGTVWGCLCSRNKHEDDEAQVTRARLDQ